MILEILKNIFALIGMYIVFRYIVYPLVDALLYAKGYMLFRFFTINWDKASKNPLSTIKILVLWYFDTFFDRLRNRLNGCSVTEIRSDKYIWRPYFHIEKIQKQTFEPPKQLEEGIGNAD